jgi:hypothetical protein
MGISGKDICVYFDEPIGLVRVDRNGTGYQQIPVDQYEQFHTQSGGKDGRELAKWINNMMGISPEEANRIVAQSMNNALGGDDDGGNT